MRVPTAFQHCLRAFQLLSSTLCMHLSISNSVFWAVRRVLERSRNACTQCWNQVGICAHPYCIPALLACIRTTFQYFMRAFLLLSIAFLSHSITFLLHFHCISITFPLHFHCISYALHFHCISFPALLACINIIPCFILALTLFLVLTLFLAFTHVCILILLIQALFWLHLHTFAFLLYSSTFLVAFTQCSGSNQHFSICAFLLCMSIAFLLFSAYINPRSGVEGGTT